MPVAAASAPKLRGCGNKTPHRTYRKVYNRVMADNDTTTCDFCGGTLDWRVRLCTQRYEDGHWTASHDDCNRADSNWSQIDATHRAWCHTEGCNKTPAYPFPA